jgi:purine nucleosidase
MHRYAQQIHHAAHAAPRIDLIIDTDPGADDVVALLFALASPEELNIRALTTVAGNVRLDKTSRNARLAREWAGREEVPVYAGAPKPLLRTPIYAEDIHGKEGLSGVAVHEPKAGLTEGHAVNYLIDTLRAAKPHSITIAMLGPQTNLALALIQAPDITHPGGGVQPVRRPAGGRGGAKERREADLPAAGRDPQDPHQRGAPAADCRAEQ